MVDSQGVTHTEWDNIASAFSSHFEALWTNFNSLSHDFLIQALPDDLNKLSPLDKVGLIGDFSKEEVFRTLMSFPSDKILAQTISV